MPAVTITLEDTPAGGVNITSTFRPTVGAPCSAAQAAALEIVSRTRRDWGMKAPLLAEVDIDAVHRTRDRVVPNPEAVAGLKALGPLTERGRGGPR